MALDMLQGALPNLAMGGDVHRDVINAVNRLSRHLPQGIPTAGAQQMGIRDMLRNTQRNALLQRILAMRGGQGGPPQPSMPLPGA